MRSRLSTGLLTCLVRQYASEGVPYRLGESERDHGPRRLGEPPGEDERMVETNDTFPSNSLSELEEDDLEKVDDLGLGDRSPEGLLGRSLRFASLSATRISRRVRVLVLIYLTIFSVGKLLQPGAAVEVVRRLAEGRGQDERTRFPIRPGVRAYLSLFGFSGR